jgi:hypothetical protein
MIRVNKSHPPNRIEAKRGLEMKKVKTGRGFWSWLLGEGWSSAGGNG